MTSGQSQFLSALTHNATQMDRVLDRILENRAKEGELARPERLVAAMRYSSIGAGKRIRPFYLIETFKLFSPLNEDVWQIAAALELIHCYSLIHDDLPAMDNDDLRRGKPTLHRAYDEATAILAGDALLTLAFEIVAAATQVKDSIRLELVRKLAQASGLGGMVGGQMLDLEAETSSFALQRADIERLQAMKTGALLHFAVIAGAELAQCSQDNLALLGQFGRKIGALFQISDDILDATGDVMKTGKKTGKDAQRNKGTLVSLLGLDESKKLCEDLASSAKALLKQIDCVGDKSILIESVDFLVSRES